MKMMRWKDSQGCSKTMHMLVQMDGSVHDGFGSGVVFGYDKFLPPVQGT